MNPIAEFLVKIGIKGDDKTKEGIGQLDSKLRDLGSTSLAVKAGIFAALYGFERFTASAAGAGAGLVNFAASTGMSMKSLQEWKHAAQQANVAGSEVESSMTTMKQRMFDMMQGKAKPEGFSMFTNWLRESEHENFDPRQALADPEYMLQRLQKFAQSSYDPMLLKEKIGSMLPGDGMFAALRQGVFNQKNYSQASVLSDGEAKNLAKVKADVANIFEKLEVNLGKMISKHGPQLLKDIERVIPKILQLTNALLQLAERLKVFESIGIVISAIADTTGAASDVVEELSGHKPDNKKGTWEKTKDLAGHMWEKLNADIGAKQADAEKWRAAHPNLKMPWADWANKHSVHVNNTNNFHGNHDPKQVGDHVAKGTKKAIQTSPVAGGKGHRKG